MLAKVMSGNSGWDVVFPSAEFHSADARAGAACAAAIIDWLPQPERARRRSFSSRRGTRSCEWSIPYMHGVTGIVYQTESAAGADVVGGFVGCAAARDSSPCWTIRRKCWAACLKKLGYSLNSGDPGELRAAQQRGDRAEAAAARVSERRGAGSGWWRAMSRRRRRGP